MFRTVIASVLFAAVSGEYQQVSGSVGCDGTVNLPLTQAECEELASPATLILNSGPSRTNRPFGCYLDTKNGNKWKYNVDGGVGIENVHNTKYTTVYCKTATTTTTAATTTTTQEPSGSGEDTTTTTAEATTTTTAAEVDYDFVSVDGTVGCESPNSPIMTVEQCEAAAVALGLADTTVTVNANKHKADRPYKCYYDNLRQSLQFNPAGVNFAAKAGNVNRPNLCIAGAPVTTTTTTAGPTTTTTTTTAEPTTTTTTTAGPMYINTENNGACEDEDHEITSPEQCLEAALYLGVVPEGTTTLIENSGQHKEERPYGCYFDNKQNGGVLKFNVHGTRTPVAADSEVRQVICLA